MGAPRAVHRLLRGEALRGELLLSLQLHTRVVGGRPRLIDAGLRLSDLLGAVARLQRRQPLLRALQRSLGLGDLGRGLLGLGLLLGARLGQPRLGRGHARLRLRDLLLGGLLGLRQLRLRLAQPRPRALHRGPGLAHARAGLLALGVRGVACLRHPRIGRPHLRRGLIDLALQVGRVELGDELPGLDVVAGVNIEPRDLAAAARAHLDGGERLQHPRRRHGHTQVSSGDGRGLRPLHRLLLPPAAQQPPSPERHRHDCDRDPDHAYALHCTPSTAASSACGPASIRPAAAGNS